MDKELEEAITAVEMELNKKSWATVKSAARSAGPWKEFAMHQYSCAVCGESVADCTIGIDMLQAAQASENP